MKRLISLAWFVAMTALLFSGAAQAQRAKYDALVAKHAKTYAVPEALVHRVIVHESRYQAALLGRGGTIGLMQIKLATARGLGYTGDAEGLRDPDTNLLYGVKYLAGAYRVANGDHDRAIHYYANGYYEAAKRWRIEHARHPEPMLAGAPPKDIVKDIGKSDAAKDTTGPAAAAKPEDAKLEAGKSEDAKSHDPKPEEAKPEEAATLDERTRPLESAKSAQLAATPKESAKPHIAMAKPKKPPHKKLADAMQETKEKTRELVPPPPARIPRIPGSANAAKPR
jgi:hypothetical protein